MKQIKLYGWCDSEKTFNIKNNCKLRSYLVEVSGIKNDISVTIPSVKLEHLVIIGCFLNANFLIAFKGILKPEQIKCDSYEWLIHTYGKSFKDLLRIRNGIIEPSQKDVFYSQSDDVSEIATRWKNLVSSCYHACQSLQTAIIETGSNPWCDCHVNHMYKTGSCLSFIFTRKRSDNPLNLYSHVKNATEHSFNWVAQCRITLLLVVSISLGLTMISMAWAKTI